MEISIVDIFVYLLVAALVTTVFVIEERKAEKRYFESLKDAIIEGIKAGVKDE